MIPAAENVKRRTHFLMIATSVCMVWRLGEPGRDVYYTPKMRNHGFRGWDKREKLIRLHCRETMFSRHTNLMMIGTSVCMVWQLGWPYHRMDRPPKIRNHVKIAENRPKLVVHMTWCAACWPERCRGWSGGEKWKSSDLNKIHSTLPLCHVALGTVLRSA